MKRITSRDNSLFKHLRELSEDTRYRRTQAVTIADGEHLVMSALDLGWPVFRLIVRAGEVKAGVEELLGRCAALGIEVLEFGAALFDQISPVASPTGVLAEIGISTGRGQLRPDMDLLVLAGIQDAGNAGTLLRSAAAAGIRYAWCDVACAHLWSPKALRAGMGAHFHLEITESADLVSALVRRPQQVLVTCLDGATESLYELDLRQPCIWVFGSEGLGVPLALRDLADKRVSIPMRGGIESLNVSAAAAVCFFEQVRQRLSA